LRFVMLILILILNQVQDQDHHDVIQAVGRESLRAALCRRRPKEDGRCTYPLGAPQ
jgi:hypothetical protein